MTINALKEKIKTIQANIELIDKIICSELLINKTNTDWSYQNKFHRARSQRLRCTHKPVSSIFLIMIINFQEFEGTLNHWCGYLIIGFVQNLHLAMLACSSTRKFPHSKNEIHSHFDLENNFTIKSHHRHVQLLACLHYFQLLLSASNKLSSSSA